jgi:hypothetical protein
MAKYTCIWNILFKGHDQPTTPFLEFELAQPARIVRSLRERVLYDQFPQAMERRGITAPLAAIPFLIKDILSILFDSFLVPRPRSRRFPRDTIAAQITGIQHFSELQWVPGQTLSLNNKLASTSHHIQSYEPSPPKRCDDTLAVSLNGDGHIGADMDHVIEENLNGAPASSASYTANLAITPPINHVNFVAEELPSTQQTVELGWDAFLVGLDGEGV